MIFFANIIIDISLTKLDKTFQYRIPEELFSQVHPGVQVLVPFGSGNRSIRGYVLEVTDKPEFDLEKIKDILAIAEEGVEIQGQLIALASWMRKNYGGTMNQALKTVIPIKQKTKAKENRRVELLLPMEKAKEQLNLYEKKHNTARARLLQELLCHGNIDYDIVTHKLNVAGSVVKALEEQGILKVSHTRVYRNPVAHLQSRGYDIVLNHAQQNAVDQVLADRDQGIFATYLLHGVTGSGKTEVYMELIAHVIGEGKAAIMLIPEIALTYQTVMRFYGRFGGRVSILNSKMSAGERYDQFLRAKRGEIDIMIGPRSALFTPFSHLGLIIIDEEHENSYKSETVPRYHARETAIQRGKMTEASVVLGSATPSLESYYRAEQGMYRLLTLKQRVKEKPLPICHTVDLREELKAGNRSILSRKLMELMSERLSKKQQIMLFLNRRGISGFVSCRSCGEVMKCPHCDVSLSLHRNNRLICHYCGYEKDLPGTCPTCGSRYISGFKAGTQKIEELVSACFPKAKILRMDFDTTRKKGSYEEILSAFSAGEADILIGTQMIVKGHDFPNVTLVGILAADMSMYVNDYCATERTFALLTQAAGRAGRGNMPGEVVIQTYNPEHFAIKTAEVQDYESFYQKEITYRKMMHYPPVFHMAVVIFTSEDETSAVQASIRLARVIKNTRIENLQVIGPAGAAVAKVKDIYRQVIYLKHPEYESLVTLKDRLELFIKEKQDMTQVNITFDFDPIGGF
ncbi:MAG: primosomal protein N' [Roseburia sp.]|nr:primosomal protein N' [Roseburia sp.]